MIVKKQILLIIHDEKLRNWLTSNPIIDPDAAIDRIFVSATLSPNCTGRWWPVVDGARRGGA